jgi:hypothetical protein
MLAMLSLLGCTSSDATIDRDDPQPPVVNNGRVAVDLALSVSTTSGNSSATTRMAATTVQADGSYRGIQNLKAYALDGDGNVLDVITNLQREPNDESTYHYFTENVDLSIGTQRFICYAQAIPGTGATNAENGAFVTAFNDNLPESSFTPKQMVTQSKMDNPKDADYQVARNMATYLTSIAKVPGWSTISHLSTYYNSFINGGNLIAGSTANVKALVKELKEDIEALSLSGEEQNVKDAILKQIGDVDTHFTDAAYPANIGLPDGAAAMMWVADKPTSATDDGYPKFVPQVKAPDGSTMPLSDHDRFVYPPELYYYIDSPIKTSEYHRKSDYTDPDWSDVLATYSYNNATVSSTTRSVAVTKALDYAVGCMAVSIYTEGATLEDNSTSPVTPVAINDNTKHFFPLTGIQVDGQYVQTYEFLPMEDKTGEAKQREYIIYDKVPFDKDNTTNNIYLTQATTTSEINNLAINYTLAFQSRDGKPVDIVLEFLNDSEAPFYGYQNGVVYPGTKFYLIGQIWPPNVEAPKENKDCRVFTKDYKSVVRLNIKSLKNAYNVIPDLKTAQYAIKVSNVAVKQWSNGGSQNHDIYNW